MQQLTTAQLQLVKKTDRELGDNTHLGAAQGFGE